MPAPTFRLVEVQGPNYEMGRQHGAGCADLIARSLATYERILATLPRPATLGQARLLALQSLDEARAYAPHLVEEVRGIADGARMPFEDVFALNASLDLISAFRRRACEADVPHTCSSYGVTSPASADGETYVGWNADDRAWWLPSCVLLRGRPRGGLPFLLWTFAGFVGRPGMNAHLALGANGLGGARETRGVPYPFICRTALAQTSTAAAVAAISAARALSRMNYLVGDAAGALATVELTGTDHAVIGPSAGWLTHTNYICDARLQDAEGITQVTCRRQPRWHELMHAAAGRISLGHLAAMQRDHMSAPESICRHPQTDGDVLTLTALLCLPARGRMLVAYGPPCAHDFVEYSLE